jgi:Resolvase, N terminal domain
MLDQLRHGDTVIVWKLGRLARSSGDLLETMETIAEAGACEDLCFFSIISTQARRTRAYGV